MKVIALTNQEKLSLLKKTKEIYVKQYTACLLNNLKRISTYYEPMGLCGCFYRACNESGYFIDDSYFLVSKIIPEWNREFAYHISPLDFLSGCNYASLSCAYWFPIWDKASRINFINWLIFRYTE